MYWNHEKLLFLIQVIMGIKKENISKDPTVETLEEDPIGIYKIPFSLF